MSQRRRMSRRSAVRAAGTALAAGAALAAGMAPGAARAGGAGASLVGVWVVTSSRAGSVPNGILVTVHPDGTFLRTGNTHPTESPAMGVWQQVSDGVYDVSYVALSFDNTGAYSGRRKARLRITLDPSSATFTGKFNIVTLDVNNVAAAPIEGDITGTRMVLEPFA